MTTTTLLPAPSGLRRVEHVMGMPVGVDVRDAEPDRAAVDAAFSWLRYVDATFSTYREDSAIRSIERGDLRVARADGVVREVLDACERLREQTCGFFDARAGGSLDPSGYVKGWAVERAAGMLAAAGMRSFCVNAGGDLRLRGEAAPGEPWRVGVQHPLDRGAVAAVVVAGDLAVATSGVAERGAHVLDPHTRRPADGILSMTVIGPDLALADAYATAAMAMGGSGAAWVRGLDGYAGMAVTAERTVLTTPGFDRHLAG